MGRPNYYYVASQSMHSIRCGLLSVLYWPLRGGGLFPQSRNFPLPPKIAQYHQYFALLRNLDKRFGDTVKQVAVAARIFDPRVASTSVPKEETSKALELLCSTLHVVEQSAVSEWIIFAPFLAW